MAVFKNIFGDVGAWVRKEHEEHLKHLKEEEIRQLGEEYRRQRGIYDAINQPISHPRGFTTGGTDRMQINNARAGLDSAGPTQTETPIAKAYPLEGDGIRLCKDLAGVAHPEVLVGVLVDMTQSNNSDERTYAAMHKDTPISAIITNLLADKNPRVKYLAEKRVEADDGAD